MNVSQVLEETERQVDSGVVSQNEPQSSSNLQKDRPIRSSPVLAFSAPLYPRFEGQDGSDVSMRFIPSSVPSSSPLVSPRKPYYYPSLVLPQSSRVAGLRVGRARVPSVLGTYADSNYLPQTFAKAPLLPHYERSLDLGVSPTVPRLYSERGYSRTDLLASTCRGYPYLDLQRSTTTGLNESQRNYQIGDLCSLIENNAKLLSEDDRPKCTSSLQNIVTTSNPCEPSIESLQQPFKTIQALEHKLDQYIQQIRELHSAVPPLDDEPQYNTNTSGDLLNESLSEDNTPIGGNISIPADLAPSKLKSNHDENTPTRLENDKLGHTPSETDSFTQPNDVPGPNASPKSASVISRNNVAVTPFYKIDEVRDIDNVTTEGKEESPVTESVNLEVKSVQGNIQPLLEDNQNSRVEEGEEEIGEGLRDTEENSQRNEVIKLVEETKSVYPDEYEKQRCDYQDGMYITKQVYVQENDMNHAQNADGNFNQESDQNYVHDSDQTHAQDSDQNYDQDLENVQNAEQNYDQGADPNYVQTSDQNDIQSIDQNYYQEFEGGDQTQAVGQYDQKYSLPYGEQYDQDYEQYQFQEDPNQMYETIPGQYPDVQEYVPKENADQKYGYGYEDPNLGQQFKEQEKYDEAPYEKNNEAVYSGYADTGDVNGQGYERDGYVEQEREGYAEAGPARKENESKVENVTTKRRDQSDSESTIEKNTASNAESDFDFN